MNIEVLSKKIICSNDDSIHNYFGWPSVARLHDGRLAMVASGFRLGHICPFGKAIISFSEDEGKTWSQPTVVIDTPLDDRDGGITAFGENDVIVTSFNNSIEAQRTWSARNEEYNAYINSYLDVIEKNCDWEKYLGSTYRISHDDGKTFGEIMRIPVTCPHGPAAMPDGSLLYVGRKFSQDDKFHSGETHLSCYRLLADGSCEFLSEIENVGEGLLSCEPHTIVLEDGKVIVHIRVQNSEGVFTIYQCESYDSGKSFTRPHRLLSEKGGSPAHIINHNGTLISVYGYRCEPYGIRVMFSRDEGETWDVDNVILDQEINGDLGYPASAALNDGSILTVYYAHPDEKSPAVIMQVIWKYSEEQ